MKKYEEERKESEKLKVNGGEIEEGKENVERSLGVVEWEEKIQKKKEDMTLDIYGIIRRQRGK